MIQLKEHHSKVAHEQLDEIKVLKGKAIQTRRLENQTKNSLQNLQKKNKQIVEPYTKAKVDLEEIKDQTVQYMKIKEQLKTHKLILKAKEDELKELKWCHELLYQRLLLMENDAAHLKEKMEDVTQAKRQQKNLDELILKEKVTHLEAINEQQRAVLAEIITRFNIDMDSDKSPTSSIQDVTNVIDEKNKQISELEEEIRNIREKEETLLQTRLLNIRKENDDIILQ